MDMWSLILVAIALFLVAIALGYIVSNSKIWDYVDLVYYPVGAVGVALLFWQQSSEREILRLLEKRESIVSQTQQINKAEPDLGEIELTPTQSKLIQTTLSHVNLITGMSEACSGSLSADPKCLTARSLGPVVEPYLPKLKFNGQAVNLHKICKASGQLLDEIIKSNAIGGYPATVLKEHYILGLNKGFYWHDYNAIDDFVAKYEPKVRARMEPVIKILVDEGYDQSKLEERLNSQINYGRIVLRSFHVCLRAPETIRSGDYERWRESYQATLKSLNSTDEELNSLSVTSLKSDNTTLFSFLIWPFVIVFALALKFAKAVASIRTSKN